MLFRFWVFPDCTFLDISKNLICMYHKSDRRRTAANIRATLPDMDEDMAALARQTADKLDAMNDADFEARQFHFTDE